MKMIEDPYPEMPGQRDRALEVIRKEIESWPDVTAEFKDLVKARADSFISLKKLNASRLRFYGGQLGWKHWVIKNDDLKLLGQLGPAAMAIVTYLSVADAPVAVMAFGLALSMLGLVREFKAKSVVVSPEDYYILMTLKQAGPSTVKEIARVLSGLHIYGRGAWDEARTLAALNKLKRVPLGNGTTTALVNESSDGRWSTAGI